MLSRVGVSSQHHISHKRTNLKLAKSINWCRIFYCTKCLITTSPVVSKLHMDTITTSLIKGNITPKSISKQYVFIQHCNQSNKSIQNMNFTKEEKIYKTIIPLHDYSELLWSFFRCSSSSRLFDVVLTDTQSSQLDLPGTNSTCVWLEISAASIL